MIATFPIKHWLRKRTPQYTLIECRTLAHAARDEDVTLDMCVSVQKIGVDWMLTIDTETEEQAMTLRKLLEYGA